MAIFKDGKGDEWDIRPNGPMLERIHKELDVNICSLGADGFDKMSRDFVIAGQVIYFCCKKQADEKEIDAEEFGERLAPVDENNIPFRRAVDALLAHLKLCYDPDDVAVFEKVMQQKRQELTIAMEVLDEEPKLMREEIKKRMLKNLKEAE